MMAMENLAQYSPFFRSEDGKCQFYIKRILIYHQKIDKNSIFVQTLSIGLFKDDFRILTLLMNVSNFPLFIESSLSSENKDDDLNLDCCSNLSRNFIYCTINHKGTETKNKQGHMGYNRASVL